MSEADKLAQAEAAEKDMMATYTTAGHGNGAKPVDAFEELKKMAAAASVKHPPKAITIK